MANKTNLQALLQQLNLAIRQTSEHAEPELEKLNVQLRLLHDSGLFADVTLMGPIVLTRPYGDAGPQDTGQVVQAALVLPGGFGAIFRDTEESFAEHDSLGEFANRIVPFEKCELAIRSLLAPCALPLTRRLLSQIRIYPDRRATKSTRE